MHTYLFIFLLYKVSLLRLHVGILLQFVFVLVKISSKDVFVAWVLVYAARATRCVIHTIPYLLANMPHVILCAARVWSFEARSMARVWSFEARNMVRVGLLKRGIWRVSDLLKRGKSRASVLLKRGIYSASDLLKRRIWYASDLLKRGIWRVCKHCDYAQTSVQENTLVWKRSYANDWPASGVCAGNAIFISRYLRNGPVPIWHWA